MQCVEILSKFRYRLPEQRNTLQTKHSYQGNTHQPEISNVAVTKNNFSA